MTSTSPVIGGIAVHTAITAGNTHPQHAEGIVVSTTLKAGGLDLGNHAEGLVS